MQCSVYMNKYLSVFDHSTAWWYEQCLLFRHWLHVETLLSITWKYNYYNCLIFVLHERATLLLISLLTTNTKCEHDNSYILALCRKCDFIIVLRRYGGQCDTVRIIVCPIFKPNKDTWEVNMSAISAGCNVLLKKTTTKKLMSTSFLDKTIFKWILSKTLTFLAQNQDIQLVPLPLVYVVCLA